MSREHVQHHFEVLVRVNHETGELTWPEVNCEQSATWDHGTAYDELEEEWFSPWDEDEQRHDVAAFDSLCAALDRRAADALAGLNEIAAYLRSEGEDASAADTCQVLYILLERLNMEF